MDREGKPAYRLVAAIIGIALIGGACGGRPQVFEEGPQARAAGTNLEGLELPDPIPAVPAFVVEARKPLSASDLRSIAKVEGTAVAVPASVRRVKVSGPGGSTKLDVAAVSPIDFRSVSPAATKAADFVWFALLGGDVVLTSDAARKLKLGSETEIQLHGIGDATVGALADNATPNFADALVTADGEDFGAPHLAIVGARSGVTLNEMAANLRRSVKGAKVSWLLPKSEKVATQQILAGTTVVSTPTISGLHPALAEAVGRLIAAAQGRVWIVSGYRDSARQYELWVQALQKYGDPEVADNWVAPPGSSYHERGLAVDLGGDTALAARLVEELGLPLWRPMSWEPWHFELAGSRG
jgi:hypothetical protein